MVIALLIILLALVAGGFGLLVEGLAWILIIAIGLRIAGVFLGARSRSART